MRGMATTQPDLVTGVQTLAWEGHAWSEWYPFDTAISPRNARAPDGPGLYRLRCHGQAGLIYIGETGDSLKGRFRQLRKATVYAAQGKYTAQGKVGAPPHVAGGACGSMSVLVL